MDSRSAVHRLWDSRQTEASARITALKASIRQSGYSAKFAEALRNLRDCLDHAAESGDAQNSDKQRHFHVSAGSPSTVASATALLPQSATMDLGRAWAKGSEGTPAGGAADG